MPSAPRDGKIRIGFQTSITALFVAIVVVVGLSLVYLSFDRITSITESAAGTFIDEVAQHTADRIDAQFKDVSDSLEILRHMPPVRAGAVHGSPDLYVLLASMLRSDAQVYSFYIGYDDGTFVQLDAIDRGGAAARSRLGAPEGAAFRLFVISRPRSGGQVLDSKTTFLNDKFVPLTISVGSDKYDPRTRPWYIGAYATEASALTDPYIFYATGEPGYTLRAPIEEGRHGVVAGDILLGAAEEMLRKQQLGRSGMAFLFDDADRIVVHPKMADLLAQKSQDADGLPRLSTNDRIGVVSAVQAWKRGGSPQQVFKGNDGRLYIAAFRSIKTAGTGRLQLAVLAPFDEFFSEIEKARRNLFFLTLALVAAVLPVVFWVGSLTSRSLRRLASQTDRIQKFQLEEAPQVQSNIREIDDLGRSVHTLRTVVQTFGSFVPKRLVQQLIEAQIPFKLGGTRREVTVLFSDVANFTAITEHASPEDVMVYTSRYFAVLSDAVVRTGGTIDKFIGDAIMAFWNAPADDENHVVNGCAAALACLEANAALNTAFERDGWPAYSTRFGLHVGEAIVGNIGSAERMNYTALGATINLAARLEALNKQYGTSILVSEAVRQRAGSEFVFRSIDRVRPKGFEKSFAIFELRCRGGLQTSAEAAFCLVWETTYARMSEAAPGQALKLLQDFLVLYPDDAVAKHHAGIS